MVARVHATAIPQLTSDQKAELGQTMRALGYRVEVRPRVRMIQLLKLMKDNTSEKHILMIQKLTYLFLRTNQ